MNIIYIFQCYTLNLNTAAKIIIDTFQSFFVYAQMPLTNADQVLWVSTL